MATLNELILRVRLKCDDNEAVKVFDDAFYTDEVTAAVKAHDTALTVATLGDSEEHLVVWLASSQVCLGRAAKQTSGSSFPTQEAGNIDDVSLEGLSAKKFDPLASVTHWTALAKEYQSLYDSTSGGEGLSNISQAYLMRYDRESQMQQPSYAYVTPTASVLNVPSDITATSMRLKWTANQNKDFFAYKIYQGATGVTDENGTLVTTQYDRNVIWYDVKGLTTATAYYFAVYTWNTTSSSVTRAFGISNEVTGTTL